MWNSASKDLVSPKGLGVGGSLSGLGLDPGIWRRKGKLMCQRLNRLDSPLKCTDMEHLHPLPIPPTGKVWLPC